MIFTALYSKTQIPNNTQSILRGGTKETSPPTWPTTIPLKDDLQSSILRADARCPVGAQCAKVVLVVFEHDVDANSPGNGNGTGLERRFATETFRIVQIPHEQRADANFRDDSSQTLSHQASRGGYIGVFGAMASIYVPDKDRTPSQEGRRKDTTMVCSCCRSMERRGEGCIDFAKTIFCV